MVGERVRFWGYEIMIKNNYKGKCKKYVYGRSLIGTDEYRDQIRERLLYKNKEN